MINKMITNAVAAAANIVQKVGVALHGLPSVVALFKVFFTYTPIHYTELYVVLIGTYS